MSAPATMDAQQLAALLADIRDEVLRGGSFDGTLTYEALPERNTFAVSAFYRVGNDEGQGGCVVVRAFES